MSDPEFRYRAMLDKLKARGSRLTSHRLALLRLLATSEGHPNASQLHQQLRLQYPTASLASVYKTLVLLKEEREVLEIDLHDDSHFDGNKPYPHPHLICNRCGQIMDGDEVLSLDSISQEIAARYTFQVVHSQVVFFGICQECQKAADERR
jgi:Fur family transcriptional regulator, peroxide stress response regulator